MYRVPQAGLTKPAVAGQLERGVRPHRAYCDGALRSLAPQRYQVSAEVVAGAVLRCRGGRLKRASRAASRGGATYLVVDAWTWCIHASYCALALTSGTSPRTATRATMKPMIAIAATQMAGEAKAASRLNGKKATSATTELAVLAG